MLKPITSINLVGGYYWIRSATTTLQRVYCDIELECSGVKGGWMSIAYLDTTKGRFCPYPWSRFAMPGTLKHVRQSPIPGGCHSGYYSTQE